MSRTKAEYLEWLGPKLTCGRVLPLDYFRVTEWRNDRTVILDRLGKNLGTQNLIVRSSAIGEDGPLASCAGRFKSVAGVSGAPAVSAAVDDVIASYGDAPGDHQVLVQPMLPGVLASGVVFTREPASGAPYYVVNYDRGADTSAVTGGKGEDLQTYYHWKEAQPPTEPMLAAVLSLARELERLLERDSLDLEFGWTGDSLVLFQVRPLLLKDEVPSAPGRHREALSSIARKIGTTVGPKHNLRGRRTVYGIMPDWNPAEIIGVRPRPLALSLYRDLVTDSIWAYQRHNYGYANLRSFPLLVDFHGLPYIDVRVSFNSFVPADIDENLGDRLVNYYIDRLVEAPALHDKIEFEVVLSCYSFDLPDRLARLPSEVFSAQDKEALTNSLRRLTNRVINRDNGLWLIDNRRIENLQRRHAALMDADLDKVSRIYWLLEDCKRYGTLPFAGLARAAFIATQILHSLVNLEVFSPEDLRRFMAGLDTVGSAIGRDFRQLDRTAFLSKYGHLRPGTYDILSPRYDETPDRYFDWSMPWGERPAEAAPFALSLKQMRAISALLSENGMDLTVEGLFDFMEAAIRGREFSKFVFTKSLSDAISLFGSLGAEFGYSVDDMSYADVNCVGRLYSGSFEPAEILRESITLGRERYGLTRNINLPPLILGPADAYGFHQPPTEPNFVTHHEAIGPARHADPGESLKDAIVLLPNADPGHDWIFSREIAGFITAYGGANSHMAVRASELNIPAVIGVGQALYATWSRAQKLRIDCVNRQVQVLQ